MIGIAFAGFDPSYAREVFEPLESQASREANASAAGWKARNAIGSVVFVAISVSGGSIASLPIASHSALDPVLEVYPSVTQAREQVPSVQAIGTALVYDPCVRAAEKEQSRIEDQRNLADSVTTADELRHENARILPHGTIMLLGEARRLA